MNSGLSRIRLAYYASGTGRQHFDLHNQLPDIMKFVWVPRRLKRRATHPESKPARRQSELAGQQTSQPSNMPQTSQRESQRKATKPEPSKVKFNQARVSAEQKKLGDAGQGNLGYAVSAAIGSQDTILCNFSSLQERIELTK